MAKPLTSQQRQSIAEKLMEWGNLVFAGLVIGQAFSGEQFNVFYALLGLVSFGSVYLLAIRFLRGGEK